MAEVSYTKEQLQELANKPGGVFESNQGVNELHATADGQFFTERGNAFDHTRISKLEQAPVLVTRVGIAKLRDTDTEEKVFNIVGRGKVGSGDIAVDAKQAPPPADPPVDKGEGNPPADSEAGKGEGNPPAPRDYAAEFKGKFGELKVLAIERQIDLKINTKAAQIIAALEAQDKAAAQNN